MKLAEEQAEIENLERTGRSREIAEAQQLFKESDEADKQLREVEPRRAELAILRTQQGNSSREAKDMEKRVAGVEPAGSELVGIEKELAALGDPRSLQAQPPASRRRARLTRRR